MSYHFQSALGNRNHDTDVTVVKAFFSHHACLLVYVIVCDMGVLVLFFRIFLSVCAIVRECLLFIITQRHVLVRLIV